MEISNPRRILAVSLEGSTEHLSRVIRDLTGTHPTPAIAASPATTAATAPSSSAEQPPTPSTTSSTLAGTTHQLTLKTAYYTASVPIWLDVIASPDEWAASFLSSEAKEVLAVLGGLVVVFAIPPPSSTPAAAGGSGHGEGKTTPASAPTRSQTVALLDHVGRVVREGLGGWEWDGVSLAVGVGPADGPDGDVDEWEDLCAGSGLEFVHVSGGATGERNEFGEKVGIPRALEALEANDWAAVPSGLSDGEIEGLEEEEEGSSDFGDFARARGNVPRHAREKGAAGTGDDNVGDEDDEDDEEFDPESLDFGFDREDFAGLRRAIWNAGRAEEDDNDDDDNDKVEVPVLVASREGPHMDAEAKAPDDDAVLDDDEVRKLDGLMRKLQAVRDLGAGLPEEQRRRLAARAVGEVMKEL